MLAEATTPPPATTPSLAEGVTLEEWRKWQSTSDRPLTQGVIQKHAMPTVIDGRGTFARTAPKQVH